MKKSKKLVYGVGVNDADYFVTKIIDGKQVKCPFYMAWSNMVKRCYSKHKYITYEQTIVCDEWLTFSNFKKWMETQDWEDKELDKDILGDGSIYSPSTCCFVSHEINSLITGQNRTKLTGAAKIPNKKQYMSYCNVSGKRKYIGCFQTQEKAHNAYLLFKHDYILKISETIKDVRVVKGLIMKAKEIESKKIEKPEETGNE